LNIRGRRAAGGRCAASAPPCSARETGWPLVSDAGDGVHRQAGPLKVTPFKLPDGCIGAYYPEMNPLVALSHHDRESKTPASKSAPVRIVA